MLTDDELQQAVVKADPAMEYRLFAPPPPNYRMSLNGDTSTCLQFYIKRPPNRLQRWLTWKLFGIKGEVI